MIGAMVRLVVHLGVMVSTLLHYGMLGLLDKTRIADETFEKYGRSDCQ